jgi:hypothetical protein
MLGCGEAGRQVHFRWCTAKPVTMTVSGECNGDSPERRAPFAFHNWSSGASDWHYEARNDEKCWSTRLMAT